MILRVKKSSLHTYLILACALGLLIYVTGLIDYVPRLRAQAKSPDGNLTVAIYQKRIFPRPVFPRMGAFVQITDRHGNLLYDKVIYQDDDWDDTVGSAYNQIVFDADEIRIGPDAYIPNKVFSIKKSDLTLKK